MWRVLDALLFWELLARNCCLGRQCCSFSGIATGKLILQLLQKVNPVHTHAITVKHSTPKTRHGNEKGVCWKEWFLQKTEEDEEGEQRVKMTGIHYVHLLSHRGIKNEKQSKNKVLHALDTAVAHFLLYVSYECTLPVRAHFL